MKKTNKQSTENTIRSREMIILTILFVIIFLGLMAYLIYYQFAISGNVANSSYNHRRLELLSEKVVRGKIETKDGEVLAETVVASDGTETRTYPYGNLFAHVVGYSMKGGYGLEAYSNLRLLTSHVKWGEYYSNRSQKKKNMGDTVVTTLDHSIQKAAYDALGNRDGAVVVMEPDTGKILAMVSKPDYDPNKIEELWDSFVEDTSDEGVLVNRATQGQYPPGSTFKVFTLIEYLREHPDAVSAYRYECEGSQDDENGNVINCFHGTEHGTLDLKTSFAKSCNSSFVNVGLNIKRSSLVKLCNDFGFSDTFSTGLNSKSCVMKLNEKTDDYMLMQTVIGQGDTLVTPLQMAVVASTIANNGKMMQPYLVERIKNVNNGTVRSYSPHMLKKPINQAESKILQEYMREVVESGTATALKGASYEAAGKTGSAEFGTKKGKSHAWFIGYATKDEKQVALSVIVEGAGTGGGTAVPMAKKIFNACFE